MRYCEKFGYTQYFHPYDDCIMYVNVNNNGLLFNMCV